MQLQNVVLTGLLILLLAMVMLVTLRINANRRERGGKLRAIDRLDAIQ